MRVISARHQAVSVRISLILTRQVCKGFPHIVLAARGKSPGLSQAAIRTSFKIFSGGGLS